MDRPQNQIPHELDGTAYIILNGAIAKAFAAWANFVSTAPGVGYAYLKDYARSRPDIAVEAASPEALAARLEVDPGTLGRTIELHNAEPGNRPRLTVAPYYALGPAKSSIMFGEGGLQVDWRLRVLDREHQPIAGLDPAGSCGQGGIILEGHGHHLAWAFTSGRLAGRNAALSMLDD